MENFLSFVEEVCPWFPEEGTVDFETLKRVGIKLQDYYSAHGHKKVPVDTFSLWNQIRDCLDLRHEGHRWSEGLMRGKSTSTSSLKETGELTPTAPEDQGELMLPPPPENPCQEAKEELLLAQEHHYDDLFNGLMPQNKEDLKDTAAHYHDDDPGPWIKKESNWKAGLDDLRAVNKMLIEVLKRLSPKSPKGMKALIVPNVDRVESYPPSVIAGSDPPPLIPSDPPFFHSL